MGRRALEIDGFMMLSEIESPHESVRNKLKAKVIDQDQAIDSIIEALDRSGTRPDTDHRPIAALGFLGPTGVGKSETAKTLAALLGDNNLIKIDCSNYSNGHEVTALVGSPPSFVGHEITPMFAKSKVEVPGTVILIDELEKGSNPLFNLLLQVMGDGQLRLNNGEQVSFRQAIIILTSNLGATEMSKQLSATPIGFGQIDRPNDKESLERTARKSFTDFFKPEFTNRIDKLVVFHPLGDAALNKVLDVKLAEANDFYEKQFGVRVSLSEETRSHLVTVAAQEAHLGARPLVRALETNIQPTFGRYAASGMLREGTHVRVVHRNEVPNAPATESPFIFTARRDFTIKKAPPQLAIEALPEVVVEEGAEEDAA